MQHVGTRLDCRHTVRCLWVSVMLVSNDTYSLLSVTDSITSFGVADKRLLLWYKRQLLLSVQGRQCSVDVAGRAMLS